MITEECDLSPQSCIEIYCYWQFGSIQVILAMSICQIWRLCLFSFCVDVCVLEGVVSFPGLCGKYRSQFHSASINTADAWE